MLLGNAPGELNRFMELEDLKILFIGRDERFAQTVADWLRNDHRAAEIINVPTPDAGYAMLATNVFHIILFDLPAANAAGLFQVTSLTTKAPRLPLVVFNPTDNEEFSAEVIFNGAQDCLAREKLRPPQCNMPSAARLSGTTNAWR